MRAVLTTIDKLLSIQPKDARATYGLTVPRPLLGCHPRGSGGVDLSHEQVYETYEKHHVDSTKCRGDAARAAAAAAAAGNRRNCAATAELLPAAGASRGSEEAAVQVIASRCALDGAIEAPRRP